MTVKTHVKKEKCPFFDHQYHLLMQILGPIFFHKLKRSNITHCLCISCPLSTGCPLLFSLVYTPVFSALWVHSNPSLAFLSRLVSHIAVGLADRDPRRLLMGS